jgi:acyl dehydratase
MGATVEAEHLPWAQDVTRDSVRHFAWGTGDNNPLWVDPAHAEGSRWGGIIAPPCFAYAVHETTVAAGFSERQRIYASVDWQWFDVIPLGAHLLPTVTSVGSTAAADGVTQTGTIEFHESAGKLLARAVTSCLRPSEPRPLGAEGAEREDRRYSEQELAAIEQAVLGESRRGAQIRYWEDAAVGDQLGTLTKGPLSIMDIVAWCAGALGVPDRESGVSAGGLADEAATGPQLTAWFAHLVTDWAGDDAFLHRLTVTIAHQPCLGSTTRLAGEVTERRAQGERRMVQLYLTATNADSQVLATATAAVVLASKEHGPVRLPIADVTDNA